MVGPSGSGTASRRWSHDPGTPWRGRRRPLGERTAEPGSRPHRPSRARQRPRLAPSDRADACYHTRVGRRRDRRPDATAARGSGRCPWGRD